MRLASDMVTVKPSFQRASKPPPHLEESVTHEEGPPEATRRAGSHGQAPPPDETDRGSLLHRVVRHGSVILMAGKCSDSHSTLPHPTQPHSCPPSLLNVRCYHRSRSVTPKSPEAVRCREPAVDRGLPLSSSGCRSVRSPGLLNNHCRRQLPGAAALLPRRVKVAVHANPLYPTHLPTFLEAHEAACAHHFVCHAAAGHSRSRGGHHGQRLEGAARGLRGG